MNGFRFCRFALAITLILLRPAIASALDPDLARYVAAKQGQVREYSQGLTNKVPLTVWNFFDAVRVDDWETATNIQVRLDKASGRFTNELSDVGPSAALRTLIWAPISETIGAYDQFHNWDNKLLRQFGRRIIDSIPPGSIYFGGTDPGRFVVSALCESQQEARPFFILTQNQLVDRTYLEYLRKMYRTRIYLPTAADSDQAFQEYVADAQQRLKQGKLKPGEEVRVVNDRVQVSGHVAVMAINGLLVKIILNKNPDREIYIEESFPLDWMYPQLAPHGLILRLHPRPGRHLSRDVIRKDQAYWKDVTGELIGDWITENTSVKELCDFVDKIYLSKDREGFKGDPAFAKDEFAQKAFSKLRSSIAGLYVWQAERSADASDRLEAQLAAELAFKQAFALCPYSTEVILNYTKLLVDLRRPDDAFLAAKTVLRLEPDDASIKDLVRKLARKD